MANKDSQNKNGTESNPILLQEVVVWGKRPNWFKRNILNPIGRNVVEPVGKFINDEILLNKNNIRVKNALRHPKAMDAVLEGGNIAGAIVAAPFAAYTAAQTAPVWIPALKTAGQMATPSTWVGGFFDAFGTQAPAWLLNGADLGASAYFASKAGKEIDENGLNLKTGANALMSLAPFTRETLAIKGVGSALRNPLLSVNSVVDDFRMARNAMSTPEANVVRAFRNSVNRTKFINVPIEHVSTKGITEGAGLNSYSQSDVGFHFSPAGSPTTPNIQKSLGAPFVRTGTWTYTNNTKPIWATDRGNWRYQFNKEIYLGVNPGSTVAENAMALNKKGPNFAYVNEFEGKGNRSFMTTDPNFGVVLSKNVETPVQLSSYLFRDDFGYKTPSGFYVYSDKPFNDPLFDYIGSNFNIPTLKDGTLPKGELRFQLGGNNRYRILKTKSQDGENAYELQRYNPDLGLFTTSVDATGDILRGVSGDELRRFLAQERQSIYKRLDPITRSLLGTYNVARKRNNSDNLDVLPSFPKESLAVKQTWNDYIDDFFMSDEYLDRLHLATGEYFNPLDFREDLFNLGAKTNVVNYRSPRTNRGVSLIRKGKPYVGVNSSYTSSVSPETTVLHEFGHNMYALNDTPHFLMIRDANARTYGDPSEHLLATVNKEDDFAKYISNIDEFSQRSREAISDMIQNGWSPEEAYNLSKVLKETELKDFFNKDYIIKALTSGLVVLPFIPRENDNRSTL